MIPPQRRRPLIQQHHSAADMIQFRDLCLARGSKLLFEHADLQLYPGWRVGVVGANGSGKTSLFAMLQGKFAPERGEFSLPPRWRIATVAQETPALETSALEFVLDGDRELRDIEQALRTAELAHDGNRIGELHAQLAAIDGYGAAARAATLLGGLGFSQTDLRRPVAEFSGGWRMRLNLAQALISRADLMLLDEPTNHLDLDAVVWLEGFLSSYAGTLLVVSHDREFLDGCIDHVLRIGEERISLYTGNYSTYEDQRAGQLAVQQALYLRQQREIARLTGFIDRFRAKATKARQAQSRVKALARMERVVAAHVDAPFDFEFREPERGPDPALVLDRVDAGYGKRSVLQQVNCSIRAGDRIGLLGPNGAGKSTLMRLLSSELAPMAGQRIAGEGLAIGYFAQHQLEQLKPCSSPLQHLVEIDPQAREQALRDFLGGFDFRGDMADAPVGQFSGGEKSRLVLAMLVRQRPNLLLLDEPTNHLDLEMRQALTTALAEFEGSVVLVSHDRALLRVCCDEYWLVDDGQVDEFRGDLDDYVRWLTARRHNIEDTAPEVADERAERLARRAASQSERKQRLAERRPLLKEISALEARLDKLTIKQNALDTQLADPLLYRDNAELVTGAARERAESVSAIKLAEDRWIELQEALGELPEL